MLDCDSFYGSPRERQLCNELLAAARRVGRNNPDAQIMQIYKLSEVIDWYKRVAPTITDLSYGLGADPALVAGILLSERTWDYSRFDEIQDEWIRFNCYALNEWPLFEIEIIKNFRTSGAGYPSIHTEILEEAAEYLADNNETHYFDPDDIDDLRYDPCVAVISSGGIFYTAIVAKYIQQRYGHGDWISAEDMALIWGVYRAGIERAFPKTEDPDDFELWEAMQFHFELGHSLGPNGELALPFMRYAKDTVIQYGGAGMG